MSLNAIICFSVAYSESHGGEVRTEAPAPDEPKPTGY